MNKIQTCDCEGCHLKSLFFESLGEIDMGEMCKIKTEKSYYKGEIIVEEGTHIQDFMYLKEGLIKVYQRNGEISDQIISIAGPQDFVSIFTVFSDTHYHYSMSALEETTICSIDLSIIKDMILKNGKFAIILLSRISEATDRVIKLRFDISRKQLHGRIAYVLLHFADVIFKNTSFDLPLSRKEFGEFIGMTTENVIRTLSEFRKDKILSINGKTINIINSELLRKISKAG